MRPNRLTTTHLNGGAGFAPPPPPDETVVTGEPEPEGDDLDRHMQEAMQAVVEQALQSNIDLHRDDVLMALLVLNARIAVELGVIRAALTQRNDDPEPWREG
jgi:hypothetical protein